MSAPLVSIVIPTYNEEPQHLREAVQSALGQTHPNIEVIVVDDGSTRRDSREALAALHGVTILRQSNQGPGVAMNTGIRAAQGEFVLALGGDDWIESTVVSLLLEPIRARGVVGAFPSVLRFGAAEGIQDAPTTVSFQDITISNSVVATCLYRRRDWEAVGGYHKVDFVSEDWLMWLKILHCTGGTFVKAPEAVLHYRLRPGSRSRNRRTSPEVVQRGIIDMMPEAVGDLYVAAAVEGQALKRELEELRAFHNAWAPRVRPVTRIRDVVRRRKNGISD